MKKADETAKKSLEILKKSFEIGDAPKAATPVASDNANVEGGEKKEGE